MCIHFFLKFSSEQHLCQRKVPLFFLHTLKYEFQTIVGRVCFLLHEYNSERSFILICVSISFRNHPLKRQRAQY